MLTAKLLEDYSNNMNISKTAKFAVKKVEKHRVVNSILLRGLHFLRGYIFGTLHTYCFYSTTA